MGGAPRRPFLQVYILKSTLYSDFYAVNVLLGHLLLARAASGGRVSQVLEMCAGDLQRWAAAVKNAAARGELDGARIPVSASTLVLLAHACGGAAATARLWRMTESAAQPLCVASSGSPLSPPSLLDPCCAHVALQTSKICPVLLPSSDSASTTLSSCGQQTLCLYAGLRPKDSAKGLCHLGQISDYVLEVVLPHDSSSSVDASSVSLGSCSRRDHEMSPASVLEMFMTFIALWLPLLLQSAPPAITPTATPLKVMVSTPSRALDTHEHELQAVLDTVLELQSETQALRTELAEARQRCRSLEKANQWLVASRCECVATRISRWGWHEHHEDVRNGNDVVEASVASQLMRSLTAREKALVSLTPSLPPFLSLSLALSLSLSLSRARALSYCICIHVYTCICMHTIYRRRTMSRCGCW